MTCPASSPQLKPGTIKKITSYTQRVNRILYLLQHIHTLGFRAVQEYITWCDKHRLSSDLLKTVQQRRQERTLRQDFRQSDSDWFKASVTRIYNNEATTEDMGTNYLRKIAYSFSGGLAGGARRAYLDLLLHAEQYANLFALQPAIPALGPERGNTFVEGLAELARHYHHWIRPISDWQPDTHDPRRQFNSLVPLSKLPAALIPNPWSEANSLAMKKAHSPAQMRPEWANSNSPEAAPSS